MDLLLYTFYAKTQNNTSFQYFTAFACLYQSVFGKYLLDLSVVNCVQFTKFLKDEQY